MRKVWRPTKKSSGAHKWASAQRLRNTGLHDLQKINMVGMEQTRSRSYQTFIFPVFRFWLLSLRICNIWKKYVYCTTAKLSSKKRKNSLFPKKKSLVGSTPGVNFTNFLRAAFLFASFFAQLFCNYILCT